MADSRYPYTYACDFIRAAGPVGSEGVVLSRSDASQIMQHIADALGMDNHELACKLADAQLVNEENPEELKRQTTRLMAALGCNTKEGG
jgi:uncharacterized protein YidB (DUF937 family)